MQPWDQPRPRPYAGGLDAGTHGITACEEDPASPRVHNPVQRLTEVPLARGALSVCPLGGPQRDFDNPSSRSCVAAGGARPDSQHRFTNGFGGKVAASSYIKVGEWKTLPCATEGSTRQMEAHRSSQKQFQQLTCTSTLNTNSVLQTLLLIFVAQIQKH